MGMGTEGALTMSEKVLTLTKTGYVLKSNPDGSLTIYAGAKPQDEDKISNWIPAPEGVFSLYLRAYWGKQAILDGSWIPPKIEQIE